MKEKKSLWEPLESGGEKTVSIEDLKKKDVKCLLLLTLTSKKTSNQSEIPEEDRDEWLDCKWNW